MSASGHKPRIFAGDSVQKSSQHVDFLRNPTSQTCNTEPVACVAPFMSRGTTSTARCTSKEKPYVRIYMLWLYWQSSVRRCPQTQASSRCRSRGRRLGCLFGRNVTGGAPVMRSLTPSFTFHESAQVSYGTDNLAEVRSHLTGPLVADTIAGKVAGRYRRQDGVLDNVDLGSCALSPSSGAGRAQLLWTPSDALETLLGIDFAKTPGGPRPGWYAGVRHYHRQGQIGTARFKQRNWRFGTGIERGRIQGLPKGVEILATYHRSELIHESVATLRDRLIEEFIVVTLVCALLLFHLRSALVAIISLPLGILAASSVMLVTTSQLPRPSASSRSRVWRPNSG
jgi:hypothetical protein